MANQIGGGLRMCIMGGGGYLGQLLTRELQKEGHFVVILDLNFPKFDNIQIDDKMVEKINGSITNKELVGNALRGCDACFHLAGCGMSGGPSLDRHKCFEVNVNGTKNVLEECRRNGVPRIVFTSSVSVIFDGENELQMADEENTPYAKKFGNPYVESKCVAEKMVLAWNEPPKLSTCALRLRGIYGPGELRTVQRCVNLCQYGIVKCMFQKSNELLTQYSSAENTVNALILAEKSLRNGKESPAAGKKYHIVDGGKPVHPWKFWFPLIAALGCHPPRIFIPFGFAYSLAFIFELLYNLFGIEPLFTRYEASLTAITNTYSIKRAEEEIGYRPINSHNLGPTIKECQRQIQMQKANRSSAQNSIIDHHYSLWIVWLFNYIFSPGGLLCLSKFAFFCSFFSLLAAFPIYYVGFDLVDERMNARIIRMK